MQLCNLPGHFKGLLILPPTPLLREGKEPRRRSRKPSVGLCGHKGHGRTQARERRPFAVPALLPHPGRTSSRARRRSRDCRFPRGVEPGSAAHPQVKRGDRAARPSGARRRSSGPSPPELPSPREAEPLRSVSPAPRPLAAPFQMGRPWPAAEDGSPGPPRQTVACCASGGRPAGLEAARQLRAPEHEQEPRGGLAGRPRTQLAWLRRPMEAARLLALLLALLLSRCSGAEDATSAPPGSPALPARTPAAQEPSEAFEPAGSESGAVRPVVGISQRVKTRPSEKKDLGTLGYVLGIIMVVVLIGIGVGIVLGYLYKRGKDLRERQEQKANEREMQRITLPLSAFSNPACELVEENVIVVHTNPTPVEEIQGGNTPLMGQAGTPGA